MPDTSTLGTQLYFDVTQFLYREARLQDEHRYDDWEALWTDDAIYWVPANGSDIDPDKQMSIIYDNRSRISVRIKQFHTGKRHSQEPRSSLGRVVSNIELVEQDGDEVTVCSNAMIFESNMRGETVWATRNEFRLRRTRDGWRMVRKKVVLVNNDKPLFTLSFLI